MLTALLSLATSTLFGVGDFLGGFASKRESSVNVTANAHVVGFVLFTLGLLLFPAPFAWHDVRMGLISGVSGGVGVGALYAALARGRMSIVAPITAALSGSLPAAYDFIQGTQVGPFAIAGLALALVATIIVSASSGEAEEGQKEMPPSALWLSFLAGFGFSGGFIAFSLASPASGMWPLASARVTSMLLFAALALITTRRLSVDRTVRLQTFGAGVTDAAANITMITAIRIGPLAIASVLGSLYPVVTILLARIVLGERLSPLQWFGVLLALVAVILAALP